LTPLTQIDGIVLINKLHTVLISIWHHYINWYYEVWKFVQ